MKEYMTSSDNEQFQDWYSKSISTLNLYKMEDIPTKNITFVVTEGCNLKCKYCYQVHKNNINKMSLKVGMDAVDFILNEDKLHGYIDFKKHPCVILEFIGGEPLLEIDLIDKIVDYFKYKSSQLNHPWSRHYMISITTNGILYETEKVQRFLEKNKGKVSVGVTIDGTKQLHDSCRVYPDGRGSYDDVVRNVKLWVKKTGSPTTKVTLAPGNIIYLKESIEHIWDLGVNIINANCVFEEGWDESHAKIMYQKMKELADSIIDKELYKDHYCSLFGESIGRPMPEEDNKNYCGGDGNMLAIGPDGRCYPCIRFMEYSLATPGREPICIGDIYDGINNESEKLKCLKCITRRSQSTDECFNCPIASGCALCTGYDYDVFGTPDKRATYICIMHKARVLASHYYFKKLYKKLDINDEFKLNIKDTDALKIISEDELNTLKNM